MKFLFVCGLVAYCALSCAAQFKEGGVALSDLQGQKGKLFGGYTTRTRVSTLTSTVLYSCVSTLAVTSGCTGRKKRSMQLKDDLGPEDVELNELSSSHNIEERSARSSSADDKGKLFIALTTFTTLTSTERFTNTATTVSLSFACRPLGDTLPPGC